MRDYVGDPEFLLQKKFEQRIEQLYPDKYIPLYSQVSFSHTPYSIAYEKGEKQHIFIKEIMAKHNINALYKERKVDELIHSFFKKKITLKLK